MANYYLYTISMRTKDGASWGTVKERIADVRAYLRGYHLRGISVEIERTRGALGTPKLIAHKPLSGSRVNWIKNN